MRLRRLVRNYYYRSSNVVCVRYKNNFFLSARSQVTAGDSVYITGVSDLYLTVNNTEYWHIYWLYNYANATSLDLRSAFVDYLNLHSGVSDIALAQFKTRCSLGFHRSPYILCPLVHRVCTQLDRIDGKVLESLPFSVNGDI